MLDRLREFGHTETAHYAGLMVVTLVKLVCLLIFVTILIPSVLIKTQIAQPLLRYLRNDRRTDR